MNKFFNYIQPTIVRASYDEGLPENVRGRFFINFNVFGIKYFEENYILTENSNNYQYLLLKENSGIFMLEESLESEDIIDIPRIYIDITDEFINDPGDTFKSFVWQASLENAIWAQGIDGFLCGRDYYVNNTLYNYLALTHQLTISDFGCRLPNYLDESGQITQYWMDISNEPYKDYTNLEYFNERNNLLNLTYDEETLKNFYASFCQIILDNTQISDERRLQGNNPVYDMVLKYYAAFKSDSGSAAIQMILSSLYTSTTKSQKCGCNSVFGETTQYNTESCYDLYLAAMTTWLKTMLGDKDFYQDWFMIYDTDTDYRPNDILINKLRTFITEFLTMHISLGTKYFKSSSFCDCPTISSNSDECNRNILNMYLNILDYVANNALLANKNKIKVYGEQFGELLPNLQF